jgi:integrative and conjugative element protein (TIGR02256 family)
VPVKKTEPPAFEDAAWFLPDEKRRVLIRAPVLAHFHQHRQVPSSAPEAGGQLFAHLANGDIEICCATGPYREDARGRFWFKPARPKQRTDILHQFRAGLHYVGDWHTHPVSTPAPSKLDLGSMSDCFRRSHHELDAFVMVIVGQTAEPARLWVSLHTGNEQLRLNPVAVSEPASPDP